MSTSVSRKDYPIAIIDVQVENAWVRVVRWYFEPGTATGWHRHRHDYVVVPTIGGTLTTIAPDGYEASYALRAGASYFREAGVEHNVVNLGDAPVEFVEIEMVEPPPLTTQRQ